MSHRAIKLHTAADSYVPGAERLRLVRACSSCERQFLAAPWQTHCTVCEPRDGGRNTQQKAAGKLRREGFTA